MTARFTEADLAKFKQNSGREVPKKERKYKNVRVSVDGWTFDSKLEANRYKELKLLKAAGRIEHFLRQVPFHLPGGVIFRLDFMVKWPSTLLRPPVYTYEDAHGPENQGKANKIKQVKDLYGIEVELVRAAGR